jgi:nicotinate-nucleotide adenylyltransferase
MRTTPLSPRPAPGSARTRPASPVRLGLFGGTFDPPHIGHILAASDACEQLSLDTVVFVPNAVQPLKAAHRTASAADRLEMVRLACQGDARFAVDSIEVERGGLSFTVDTLRAYRERHPVAALFLLVGEDAAATLPSWREPAAILEIAELVVLARGDAVGGSVGRRLDTRRIDISATEIRERVRAGRSIHGFVADDVARYIEHHRLYTAG